MLGIASETSSARLASSENIRTVTSETFQRTVLEGDGPIAVEFMSYGCAYCRELEPILEEVAAGLKTKETVFRVNVGADPDLARSYGVQGTPTFVMFLEGTEVGRAAGPHPTVANIVAVLSRPFER